MSGIKRNALSIKDKLKILQTYDEHSRLKNQKQIAADLKIPGSTLRTILKKRMEIEENAQQGATKRKKIKTGKYEELENVLLKWFHEAQSINLPMNGVLLTEKALKIAEELQITDFTGSSGWIDRFKTRHGIVYRQVYKEIVGSFDGDNPKSWKENVLPLLLKDYKPRDVFNADEFGIFFKLMPNKTLVYKNEKCHVGKKSKERITGLLCANADGSEKIKLLVIGKAKSPRCFKNVQKFPCDYVAQNRAWMTGELFVLWATKLNAMFRRKKRNILLFIDNCAAHPKGIKLSNIKIVFLPVNGTSHLQPMAQGVIKLVKQHYRKRLVQMYLDNIEKGDLPLPHVTILDAMNFITAAWNAVTPKVIKNSFLEAGFKWPEEETENVIENDKEIVTAEEEGLDEQVSEIEMCSIMEKFSEYVSVDDDIATSEVRTAQDFIQHANACEESDEDDEEEEEPLPPPTPAAAMQALADIRRYVCTLSKISDDTISKINQLETLVLNSALKSMKQSKIDDGFNKKA